MQSVRFEVLGHVALITIDRPEARNAVDGNVAEGIALSLARAQSDETIRSVVITGTGDLAFSAGADIYALTTHGRQAVRSASFPEWGFAGIVRSGISKPVVAAVNGVAFGGGLEILLACDIVVAAEHALFGFPEVTVGVVPASGGALRLARFISPRLASELLLTGRRINAEEALSSGLVNRVVPYESLASTAIDMATSIADNAPLAVQSTLRIIKASAEDQERMDAVWFLNENEADRIVLSNDAREGAQAFREKRRPVWTAT